MKNLKNQMGFTLLELTATVVILGILATVAIPIYIDMRDQAALANVKSVAGAISSANNINQAAMLLKP